MSQLCRRLRLPVCVGLLAVGVAVGPNGLHTAAIVAFETRNAAGVRLIDEPMINTVLVMVVETSILGPILTEYFGRQCLAQHEAATELAVPAEIS